ncbi:MAG: hypothetical protein GF346_00075, partial [Candidatus Eisenbacteria bacterium]|nr:hypothetical protein [Candidatus Latescibacterota bacterium]MBD3300828.1 hypothetical protein [Candidatus Eisenbacteria bacterium]
MRREVRALVWLLAGMALVSVPARAGTVTPFLHRLAASASPVSAIEREAGTGLFAWDREEAAAGRVRVLLRRDPVVPWSELRVGVQRIAPTARWEGEAGDLAQLVLPFSDLLATGALPGVELLFRPPRGQPARIDSEGLEMMEVPAIHATGTRGRDVRVAVLDLGFAGYEALLGTELPADTRVRSFFESPAGSGDITGGGESHGTACAEIVHDVAPEAQLYLVNAATPIDLSAAVDWLIEENVSVISHSVGWYFGGLDGTGPINDIAARAARAGVLWVNSAGNEAQRHYWTAAEDRDGDGLLELAPDDEGIDFHRVGAGQTLAVVLLWDLWPISPDLDLVLEIVDDSGEIVRSSADAYGNALYAYRDIQWDSPDGAPVTLRVRRARGSIAGRTLHLFRVGSGARMEEHVRADRSLLAPADSPEVLTVGAVNWETEALERYSSRGSLDGPSPKPELCGPVGITTGTIADFRGTSAAA